VLPLKVDTLVSFAYGRIFGPKFLSLFSQAYNIHPSLLPRYRGPTPVQAAILGGDKETGVTIQKIALAMDEGDILAQEKIALNGRETTLDLEDQAASLAASLLEKLLPSLVSGNAPSLPQNNAQATYCKLISKEDGLIDWKQSAVQIDAQIRAYTPWPLCLTHHGGKELYILDARPLSEAEHREAPGTVLAADKKQGILIQTGDGILALTRLQYRTKKALDWKSFLNGAQNFLTTRLE
jgi:methionyl-tRNA formyltransferase